MQQSGLRGRFSMTGGSVMRRLGKRFFSRDTLKMLLILFAGVLLTEVMRQYDIGDQNLILVYILSVLVISVTTNGYLYGVTAAIVSVVTYDYLITAPRMIFSTTVGIPITLLIMLIVSLITCTVATRLRTHAALAAEKGLRAELLCEMNEQFLSAQDRETLIQLMLDYIVGHVKRSVVFYDKEPSGEDPAYFRDAPGDTRSVFFFSDKAEKEAARQAYYSDRPSVEEIDDEEPFPRVYYLPLIYNQNRLGLLGVSCLIGSLSRHHLFELNLVAGQAALALELQTVSERQRSIQIEAEAEKMRSNLLRAISHDLRTPLTAIQGASSTLLEQGKELEPAIHAMLLESIRNDSQWLIRMVENILSVTRIRGDTMKVTKTLEAAEEIIAQAMSIIRLRYPGNVFTASVPEQLLLIPMDALLISQVLLNLLENAARSAGPEGMVAVSVQKVEGTAVFEVLDWGAGISDAVMPLLFTQPVQGRGVNPDGTRGGGIGLTICKTIIQAHDGAIEGANRPEGGAVFRFILPLEGETVEEADV